MKMTTCVLILVNHVHRQNMPSNTHHHEYNVQVNAQIHKQLNKSIQYKTNDNVYFHVEK